MNAQDSPQRDGTGMKQATALASHGKCPAIRGLRIVYGCNNILSSLEDLIEVS